MSTSVPNPKVYHLTLSPEHISSPRRFPYMRPFTADVKGKIWRYEEMRKQKHIWSGSQTYCNTIRATIINSTAFISEVDASIKHTDYHASYCSPESPRVPGLSHCCQTSQCSHPNTSSSFHPWQKKEERAPCPHPANKQQRHNSRNSEPAKGLQIWVWANSTH